MSFATERDIPHVIWTVDRNVLHKILRPTLNLSPGNQESKRLRYPQCKN